MIATSLTYKDVQYRTFERTYRLQATLQAANKTYSIWAKIYDKQRSLLYSQELSVSEDEVQDVFSAERGDQLIKKAITKGWIPAEQIDQSKPPCDLKKMIDRAKIQIPEEGHSLGQFVCPLSKEVFVTPVLDSCGHIFEKSWIEKALEQNNSCPVNRQPISSLTPILQLREIIAEWRKRDLIPTLSLFKKANPVLARSHLEMAQRLLEDESDDAFEAALENYTHAFKHTNDWNDYKAMPLLFMKREQKEHAQLAYLYLAQYQMEAGAIDEAVTSLKAYRTLSPSSLVDAHLEHLGGKTDAAVDLLLHAASTTASPQEAIELYTQIIEYNPCCLEAYVKIAAFLESPLDKSQLFLKGACHAIERKQHQNALSLCRLAENSNPDFFLDRLIALNLQHADVTDAEQRETNRQKLILLAQDYEERQLFKQMVSAYKMLSYLEYRPAYYDKILKGYKLLKDKEQELSWSLRWLALLIDKKEWNVAASVAQQTFAETQPHSSEIQSIQNKLLACVRGDDTPPLARERIAIYRTLFYFEQNSLYCKEIVEGCSELGEYDTALHWISTWVNLLIKRKERKSAEQLIQHTLKNYGPILSFVTRTVLYEKLETIYTESNPEKLSDLWRKLGKVHQQNHQLDAAEGIYQKAVNQFPSAENFMALAELQHARGNIKQSVFNYYRASVLASAKNDAGLFALCKRSLCAIDPDMQHLIVDQKMHMLAQNRVFQLQQELASATDRILTIETRGISGTRSAELLAFGAAEWSRYFGDVGVEPPLPPDIESILNSPCPLNAEQHVKDTHMLVLIPKMVNGAPFTIHALQQLVAAPRGGGWATQLNQVGEREDVLQEQGPIPAPDAHWVLMPKQAIPTSTGKTYDQQCLLITRLGASYEVAHLLDALTCVLLERVRKGTFLFDTWGSVQEKSKECWLTFGAFSASGLLVDLSDINHYNHFPRSGIAALRRL